LKNKEIYIIKASGKKVVFSFEKLRNSLKHSGADDNLIEEIVSKIHDEIYHGISSKEIYHRAFSLLKNEKSVYASKYKLKKAIYELGPTGFPFERFVSAVLENSGFSTKVSVIMGGKCVTHEIDIVAEKDGAITIIECKFHGEEGRYCNVKVPLYINSRYNDVKSNWRKIDGKTKVLEQGWVVTNTRFTEHALQYGKCIGLYLLSWDYPKGDSLKERIDRLGLYPITVSSLLSNQEKHFLLERNVVLCRELLKENFFLDHLGISNVRKEKILQEIKQLCN